MTSVTHIYSKNSLYTIHIIQTAYYFPDHRVEAGAQTSTRDYARLHIIRIEKDLKKSHAVLSSLQMLQISSSGKTLTLWRGPARLK